MNPSQRLLHIQPPVIPIVGKLVADHPGTISLGQGVVSYPPPPQVCADLRGLDLAAPAVNLYTPVGGIPPLVERIEAKLRADNGIAVTPGLNGIMVSAGANMAFFNCLLSILDAGEEVILLSPFYFNYEMAVRMLGGRPVLVDGTGPEEQVLGRIGTALTPRTRALVTISPNNPTGAVYSEWFLRQVNALCRDRGLFHIADEAYEYFVYNGRTHFSPGSIPGAGGHTLSLFTLSKSYGMAGWRIGYAVIPAPLLDSFRKVQDTDAICPNGLAQYAALSALGVGRGYCAGFLAGLDQNRRYAVERLGALGDRLSFQEPDGAIYLYVRVNRPLNPMDLVERLVRGYGVAVIPGTAFGSTAGCWVRLGFGAEQGERFREAIDRFCRGIAAL